MNAATLAIPRLLTALLLGLPVAAFAPAIAPQPRARATSQPVSPIPVTIEAPPASTWDVVTFAAIEQPTHREQDHVETVRREMSAYSQRFIEASGLKAIYVVRDLKVAGQARAVVPDPEKAVMYVDAANGAHAPVYQRHALHHDFFHFLMGRWEKDMYFKDPRWIEICGPEVKWGDGGVNAQSGPQYALTHPAPGFVNLYAQSAVEEDMAEIFAVLMVPEERALVEQWAKDDAVLAAKLAYIPRLTRGHVEAAEASAGAASRPAR